jgi:hypothetical protein
MRIVHFVYISLLKLFFVSLNLFGMIKDIKFLKTRPGGVRPSPRIFIKKKEHKESLENPWTPTFTGDKNSSIIRSNEE